MDRLRGHLVHLFILKVSSLRQPTKNLGSTKIEIAEQLKLNLTAEMLKNVRFSWETRLKHIKGKLFEHLNNN
jgi:hypothetical protein